MNPNGLAVPAEEAEFDVVAAGWETPPPPKGFDIDDWKGFTFDWAGVEDDAVEEEPPNGLEFEDPGFGFSIFITKFS